MVTSKEHHAADIARYFQAQYADFNEDLALYQELVREMGGPILELGCGTGRVLKPLATQGISATGIDHDLAMLRRLNAQIDPAERGDLHLILADLQFLPLVGNYKLVLAPCSTLAFLNEQQFSNTLIQVRRLLAKGGRLVMDLPAPTPKHLPADQYGFVEYFHEPERGTDIQVSAAERQPAANIREVDWHYDEMLPDGTTRRRTVTIEYHLREPERLSKILSAADLSFEAAYGDYEKTEYEPGSPGLIVVARR